MKELYESVGFVIVCICIFITLYSIGSWFENKEWNDGNCPKCGGKWVYFDTTSQGGEGHVCKGCRCVTWQTYKQRCTDN